MDEARGRKMHRGEIDRRGRSLYFDVRSAQTDARGPLDKLFLFPLFQPFHLFPYVLSDPGAQLRYGGSGERFPGFVEYSARRRPRCRIPGRRCPRTVPRR